MPLWHGKLEIPLDMFQAPLAYPLAAKKGICAPDTFAADLYGFIPYQQTRQEQLCT